MRSITYLMVGASLIFGGILLQEHYGIAGRLWHYRSSDTLQPKGTQAPLPSWNFTSADHDYQVVIDISGKGPLVSVVHPPAPEVKKAGKKSKKTTAAQSSSIASQPATNDPQAQPAALPPAQPPPASSQPSQTQESGTKPQ